jgi:hypothetical protein
MKIELAVILFVAMLIFQPFLVVSGVQAQVSKDGKTDVYVGVDVAYEDLAATEQLVDKISSYANLLVIGCTGITYNETRLNEICQYILDRNMSFIVYTDIPGKVSQQWIENAKTQWGNSFLGLYVTDEIGGRQLDQAKDFTTVTSATDYADAKTQFVSHVNFFLNFFSNQANPNTLFTSDYALYNFDYEAGYDTVFAELGWNYSRQINVALCRGAATVHNRDWGVVITWTYTQPPYIESGPELYNDMVLAYQNGAKYIIVFDTNENYTQSILKQEHFDAMQQFWQYIQDNPRENVLVSQRTAYVLPEDYAYGFRGPEDKIWGLWEADTIATDISMSVASLLQMIGNKLDIIYPDTPQPISTLGYGSVVYWNDSRLIPPDWPNLPTTPSPSPTQTPKASSIPSPSPSLSSSPSPTFSPTLSPTPSSAPTENPADPTDPTTGIVPIGYIYLSIVVVTAVLVGIFMFEKKRKG